MVYHTYTKTITTKYPIIYKCEHCKKYSTALNKFTIKASYNDKWDLIGGGEARKKQRAEEELLRKQMGLYDDIVAETKKRNFKNLGYDCVCAHCRTIPKWSHFRVGVLDTIYNILCFLIVFTLLVSLVGILYHEPFGAPLFCGSISVFVAIFTTRFIIYSIKKAKVKAMEEEYMPIVCRNSHHFETKLHQLGLSDKKHHKNHANLSQ